MNLNTMLIGTDFSEASIWAAHKTAEIAKRMDFQIELVHILDTKHQDELHEVVAPESQLEDIAREMQKKFDMEIDTELHKGNPGKLLARISLDKKYGMVALGYHGHGGLLSRVGSVVSKTVRLVDKPVLVLVPSHHNDGPVIGCIDFSEQTEKINHWTHHIAEIQEKPPVFTHVAVPYETIIAATPNTGGFGMTEAVLTRLGGSEEGYRTRLEVSVRHRLGVGMDGEVEILLSHSPSKAISGFAKSRNASLVVMGRHGHNTLGARIIGSTAEHILDQSHTSVLVLP